MAGTMRVAGFRDTVMDDLRRLRWSLRRAWTGARRGYANLADSPVIFGNSFPKSGTHLLAQVLMAFPQVGLAVNPGIGPVLTFVPSTGERRPAEQILRDLQRFSPGDIGFGHVVAEPAIIAAWQGGRLAHFFMLRDLRDVVLSHAFFIGDKAVSNIHHAYYQNLTGLEAKISASILGRPEMGGLFPNVRERFDLYLGWLETPDACVVRFEEFILNRAQPLERMLDFAVQRGFQLRLPAEQARDVLAQAIDPKRSFTFRSGQVGEWRQHFSVEHKSLFKIVAGDLLIRLGYEKDNDW